MIMYPKAKDVQKSIYIGKWNGKIPVYHVPSMHALNQLVGYIKHINSGEGTVLYRGQCDLYKTVSPSICHDTATEADDSIILNNTIDCFLKDKPLMNFFDFDNKNIFGWDLYERLIIEATIQHYGGKTYCIDFVDNPWTALWFGLYRWEKGLNKYILRDNEKQANEYKYIVKSKGHHKIKFPRKPKLKEIVLSQKKLEELGRIDTQSRINFKQASLHCRKSILSKEIKKWEQERKKISLKNSIIDEAENSAHLYLFLYLAETNCTNINGVYLGDNTYTVDLRKSLPSTFLRPCAQHGWVIRGRNEKFHHNSRIVCVIRLNVDLVKNMLGAGTLLSQDNFFPCEDIDQGYKILLSRRKGAKKTKHAQFIPDEMVLDYYNISPLDIKK